MTGGACLSPAGETVGAVLGGVDAFEGRRLALAIELLGAPRDAAEIGRGRGPRGTDVLDRDVEQRLEPLLDEVADVVRKQIAVDRQPALEREPDEADRRPPQPVGTAGAGR